MHAMKTLLVAAAAIVAAVCRADPPRPLFDGTSLAGWETVDGVNVQHQNCSRIFLCHLFNFNSTFPAQHKKMLLCSAIKCE